MYNQQLPLRCTCGMIVKAGDNSHDLKRHFAWFETVLPIRRDPQNKQSHSIWSAQRETEVSKEEIDQNESEPNVVLDELHYARHRRGDEWTRTETWNKWMRKKSKAIGLFLLTTPQYSLTFPSGQLPIIKPPMAENFPIVNCSSAWRNMLTR